MAGKFNFGESPVKKVAEEIREDVVKSVEEEQPTPEHTNEAPSSVIQTTVINTPATVGVNVMLPEDYHLRLTMYNKKNRAGGIKNIATQVVMRWIDENCK